MTLNQSINAAEIFGLNLQSRLKQLGMTYKDLADEMGVSPLTVGKILRAQNKRSISLNEAEKMARLADTTLQALIEKPKHLD